jgi:hypothetical protein
MVSLADRNVVGQYRAEPAELVFVRRLSDLGEDDIVLRFR